MGFVSQITDLWRRYHLKTAPQEVFDRFRAVLASNNRALEIIADLGEKGSGEYIFDRHYLEATLAELHDTLVGSITALNILCRDRFPELNTNLKDLTEELEMILSGREERHGPLVQDLDAVPPGDWARVGGKAGHLAELRKDPLLVVPAGFVITTRAFHVLLDATGLRPDYEAFQTLLTGNTDTEVLEQRRAKLAKGLSHAEPVPEILTAIAAALEKLSQFEPTPFSLAVRSSAPEEDQEFSFAGQFHSELDVETDPALVFAAYLQVAASLFSESAIGYYRQMFPGENNLVMAACCQRMIRSKVSGVAYTLDPANPMDENLLVVGAWGLGAAVVEGQIATDSFRLSKNSPPVILSRQISPKKSGLYFESGQGHRLIDLPEDLQTKPCLDDSQLSELAGKLIHLENRFRRPLDIEWTYDQEGRLHILQARPLLVPASRLDQRQLSKRLSGYQVITDGAGKVAQQGIGCGTVYPVRSTRDLKDFPENGVLVSRRDSSRFMSVMPRAAAIITETGTPVSHMATLCRELRVPCLVGIEGIVDKLQPGEEITVDADDLRIYRGRVVELLSFRATSGMHLLTTKEFRLLRRLLKKISLLNLVDPLMENFTIQGCRTYHDILRFVHEKAVQELIDLGRDETNLLSRHLARHLDLPMPVGIIVIDIGGGLAPDAPKDRVNFQAVASEPFRAILQGMLFPEVWHQTCMPVGMRDLMNSMLSMPASALEGQYTGHNIAIIGANYVNLCFRLGYHFNIIDAYLSENERDNHIYFRFLGGASDLAKRSRRAMMIEKILTEYDFRIKTRGDLVIARHGNLTREDMTRTLDILGRLVGFTRQLDVRLDSDTAIDYYGDAFLAGDYRVIGCT